MWVFLDQGGLLGFLEVQQGAHRLCDTPPAWSLTWRRVQAKSLRAGALENVAEPDRPSGSEEPLPAKTLKVGGAGPVTELQTEPMKQQRNAIRFHDIS